MLRHDIRTRFATMENETVDSLDCMVAKGLLVTLIRHKDGKDITIEGLCKSHKQGRKALETAMKTLVSEGLVVKLKVQSVHGGHWRTEFMACQAPIPVDVIQGWVDGIPDARNVIVEPARLADELTGVLPASDNVGQRKTSSDTASTKPQVAPTGHFPTVGEPTVGRPTVGGPAAKNETGPVGTPVSRARASETEKENSSSSLLRRAADDDEAMPPAEKNGPAGPEQQEPENGPVRLADALKGASGSQEPSEAANALVRAVQWPSGKPRPRRDQIVQMAAEVDRLLSGTWTEEQVARMIQENCRWERIDFPASVVLKNLRSEGPVYVPMGAEAADIKRQDALAEMRARVVQQKADIEACERCDGDGYHYEVIWQDKRPVQGPHWCGHGKFRWQNDLTAMEQGKYLDPSVRCANPNHRQTMMDPETGKCILCETTSAQAVVPAQETGDDGEGARLRTEIRSRRNR